MDELVIKHHILIGGMCINCGDDPQRWKIIPESNVNDEDLVEYKPVTGGDSEWTFESEPEQES